MKLLLTLWTLCLLANPLVAVAQDTQDIPRFALLVGIDKYENLGPAEQLDGSRNDVNLVHQVLVNRFGFEEENIVQLVDEQATANGIREAFDQIIAMVDALPKGGPKAQVYFHFSGHGSQIEDQPVGDIDRDESDGLDETLVPHDATRQGGTQDIRDDEINALIERVVGTGEEQRASLVLVYDCCHSGSGARGATKVRQLRRNLPEATSIQDVTRKRLPPGVVFLSACHETEVEPEFRENGKTYGLLTRFLSQVLTEHETVSTLSYDLLHDAIRARYQSNSRVVQAPHPQLEASDLSTRRMPILGATVAIDRPVAHSLRKQASGNSIRVQAGRLHGIDVGSLLEVFNSPENVASDESIGFIKIVSASEFNSEASFIAIDTDEPVTISPPSSLSSSAVALLHSSGPPSQTTRLKVLLDGNSAPVNRTLEGLPDGVSTHLKELAAEGEEKAIELIESPSDESDLVLKVSGDQSSLFPSSGTALTIPSEESNTPSFLRGGWGPFGPSGKDSDGLSIGDYISRIAKARNLVSLASRNMKNTEPNYEIDFELLEVQTDADGNITSTTPVSPTANNRLFLDVGNIYAVRVTNHERSKVPVYCTALEVTPDMGIQVVAPYMEKETKLEPGEKYLCDPFECDVPGRLFEILLATTDPHDFSFVEQDDLPKTRGAIQSGTGADLGDVLAQSLFPSAGRTRGSRIKKKSAGTGWLSKVIQWEALPSALAEQTRTIDKMKTRGGPTPMAVPSPAENETSLTTSQTDDGYELVKVFYGTDREAIEAGSGEAQLSIPLIPIICGLVFVVFLVFARMKPSTVRTTLASLALVATCVTGFQYYVSMKNRSIALERTGVQYGRGRGDMEVGTCEISIPKDHRIGIVESPSIFTLEFREDPSKHVILDSIDRKDGEEFFSELKATIEKSSRHEAMVFVHGYNCSFEDAARRTGQMAYDLKYQGAPVFFSWPSQAELAGYTVDENNVTWAVPHLKKFLKDIREQTNVKSLSIIAHSMGNRAVTSALKELHLEYKEDGKLFNQVILAAPDVDAEVFKTDIAPKIAQTANQVTLYASSKDRALVASKNVHGYPRAGESGENLVVIDEIDTIDVTEIDTSLLGHNYFGDSDSIVSDMYHVLHKGQPPGERPQLRESFVKSLKYWIFHKGE